MQLLKTRFGEPDAKRENVTETTNKFPNVRWFGKPPIDDQQSKSRASDHKKEVPERFQTQLNSWAL